MKRALKRGLAALFLLLLLVGAFNFHTILQSQANGRLINYVGIVRGATQRLVKLELAGQPNGELVDYLDGILTELTTGEGPYGLPTPKDPAYQQNLAELNRMWGDLKTEINGFRGGGTDSTALLTLSEDYFTQANNTVFAAEEYANGQSHSLLMFCVVMLAVMLAAWLLILLIFSNDLVKLEDRNKTLSDLAQRDTLTGVYLFDAFKEKAQRLLDDLPNEKFAVLYTDFADFKYINDVFGYAYGDSILRQYGELLQADLREHELCARVSADNFVLLLRYQDRSEVAQRQRQVDESISSLLHGSSGGQSIATYCGICCVEDVVEPLGIDGFLDRANFARKTVKTGANQNYVYYDESIRTRLREEKDIERQMLDALERREFTVYYQPKVDLATGRIGCAEALVRWQAQGGSIIPPDRFIPVFERKFLIDRLDRYVFEEVCRWLRDRIDAGQRVLPVSVNVSRLQFYDQNFVTRYVEIRDRYRIPPQLLEIEFTESIAFDNASLLLQIVRRLKSEGFTCSIDDFGKGYSSLSLLKDLPIDTLKIDGFFFQDGRDRDRDMTLVQSIVELVKKFQIKTVAEGVEHPEQVDYLRTIGCDYVQGYVFYRPMPQSEYDKLLRQER